MSVPSKNTPLHIAVMSGEIDKVNKLLEQHGSNNNQNCAGDTPLHCSFYNCDDVAKDLIMKGSNVNMKNFLGETPLLVAAGSHSVQVYRQKNAIRVLLDHGANVNEQDHQGYTPLHKVIRSLMTPANKVEICAFLVERGANVGIEDYHGKSCLYTAVEENSSCVHVLLGTSSGRDAINVQGRTGHYPLHVAVRWENDKMAKLLLEHGADINSRNPSGKSALHIVVSLAFYNESIFNLLLRKGADVNAADHILNTPLHLAAGQPSIASWQAYVVERLLERGAASSANVYGLTPLFHAVISNSRDVVKILLENGADVNCRNIWGITPIAYVSGLGIFNSLMENGADINAQDLNGKTPLHHIAEKQIINRIPNHVVSSFLDWGASLDIKDDSGNTPSLNDSFPDMYAKFVIRKKCVNMVLTRSDDLEMNELNELTECYRLCCLEEVVKMKQLHFGRNTLFDIFAQINDPRFLGNDKLEEYVNLRALKHDFPIYSSLIRSMYRRARERVSLFHVVKNILNLPLPEEMVIHVLSFVDNDSLKNIIKAKNITLY